MADTDSPPLLQGEIIDGSPTSMTSLLFQNKASLVLLILALSMFLWDRYLNSTRDKSCPLPLPPGFMGLPFFGNTPFIIFEPFIGNVFEVCMKLFGGAYKLHIVGQPTVRVVTPDHCHKVFNGDSVEPTWPYTVRTLMGSGATSQIHGSAHKAQRRVVMRAFTPQAIAAYVPHMQRGCRQEILRWRDGGGGGGGTVSVFTQSKVLAFNVAWDLLVGISAVGKDADRLTQSFMDFIGGFISVPLMLPGTSFYKAVKAKQVIHGYIERAIADVKAAQEVTTTNDLTDPTDPSPVTAVRLILSNTGDMEKEMGDMDELAVKDLVSELLFAGHETISSVFTSAVMHLYNHPEYLAKLREHLDQEGLLRDDVEDDLSLETVNQCQYAEDVFKEILRCTPPVQGVFRRVVKTIEVDKYQVPAGWSVMAGIMETHRHNDFYHEPQTFNPNRWAKLRDQTADLRKNYLPFGSGSHTCLGKEYARVMGIIFIIELVRLCDWDIKNPKPSCTYIPSFRPRDGLPTRFSPRKVEVSTTSKSEEENKKKCA